MSYTKTPDKEQTYQNASNMYTERRRGMHRNRLQKNRDEMAAKEQELIDYFNDTLISEADLNDICAKNGNIYANDRHIYNAQNKKFRKLCREAGLGTKDDVLEFMTTRHIKFDDQSSAEKRDQKERQDIIDRRKDLIRQQIANGELDENDIEVQEMLQELQQLEDQNKGPIQQQVNVENILQNLEQREKELGFDELDGSIQQPVNLQQQLQSVNNNFSNNKVNMNQQASDERKRQLRELKYNKALERAKGMQLEDLQKKYAKQAASGKIKLQGGDPTLPFAQPNQQGTWKLKEMHPQDWHRIHNTKGNNWIDTFDKAHDFSYNPKMLDPQYAAWHGARHGTDVYYTDVNNDMIPDIIEVDEDDKIKSYNGYRIGRSKQKLWNEYYNTPENKAIANAKGKPVYPVKFDDWYRTVSSSINPEQRKALNTELSHKGMHGYKVKEASINETIKSLVTVRNQQNNNISRYEQIIATLAGSINYDPKVVKKALPVASLVGQVIRAVLFVHFNINPTGDRDHDDKVIGKLSRIANSKSYNIKQQYLNYIQGVFANDKIIMDLTTLIWANLVLHKNYEACQKALYDYIATGKDNQLGPASVQALQVANQKSEIRKRNIEADKQYKYNPMMYFQNSN